MNLSDPSTHLLRSPPYLNAQELADVHPPRASIQVLTALTSPPPQPMDFQFSCRTHFACLLCASLVSQSISAKALARSIVPASSTANESQGPSGHQRSDSQVLFVPADLDVEKLALKEAEEKKELEEKAPSEAADETMTLMQILTEYTSLAFIVRSKMQDPPHGEPPGEERDWVCRHYGFGYTLIADIIAGQALNRIPDPTH